MARIASNIKMGYYPTPEKTLSCIKKFLVAKDIVQILDPCCGDGSALFSLTESLRFSGHIGYGIELDIERALKASSLLGKRVVQGSIFDAQISPLGCFGLLFLNPPYDSEEGERIEMKFLKHSLKWLSTKGVLVFIVPEHILERSDNREWIGQHLRDIQVYRVHREDFPRFKQIVLFGYKRSSRVEEGEEISPPPYKHIEDDEDDNESVYVVPRTKGPEKFEAKEAVTEDEIHANWANLVAKLREIQNYKRIEKIIPLFPLRKGHLVTLIASGGLDGRIDTPNGYLLIKGYSGRIKIKRVEDEKEVVTDTYNSAIRVIEVESGKARKARWYDIK